MSDRDIAVRWLALLDAADDDSFEDCLRHFDARFDDCLKAEHSGDCTDDAHTCLRCWAEEAMQMAPVIRRVFGISDGEAP